MNEWIWIEAREKVACEWKEDNSQWKVKMSYRKEDPKKILPKQQIAYEAAADSCFHSRTKTKNDLYLVTEITILCSFPFIPTQLKRVWMRKNCSSSKIISSAFPSAFHEFPPPTFKKKMCMCHRKLRVREREKNVCSCRCWTNSDIIYQAFYRKNTTGFSFKVEAQQESDAFHLQTHSHTHSLH